MSFGSVIIKWYEINKRDLPWRQTMDPYHIWLSEIILQQTRIEQGLSYYHRFIDRYPDVAALAKASEDEILKLWQGLGYYSRARNLHGAARQIMKEHDGNFPSDYKSIRALKGVGDYTAAAISSFAFSQKYPVIDGNVYRLLSRHFGIATPIDTLTGKKEFADLAGKLIKSFPPAVYNQAIMEFGSRQCKPAHPDCSSCPLNASCFAFNNDVIKSYPFKKNKTKIRNRYFNYIVIRENDSFFIRQRKEKDIWQGLHDFPLIETNKRNSEAVVLRSKDWKNTIGANNIKLTTVSQEFKHVLSHQNIHARFYEVRSEKKIFKEPPADWIKVDNESVRGFAVPRLIERYLTGQ